MVVPFVTSDRYTFPEDFNTPQGADCPVFEIQTIWLEDIFSILCYRAEHTSPILFRLSTDLAGKIIEILQPAVGNDLRLMSQTLHEPYC